MALASRNRKKSAPSEDKPKKDWTMAKDERQLAEFVAKELVKPCSKCKNPTHVINLDRARLCPDCRSLPTGA